MLDIKLFFDPDIKYLVCQFPEETIQEALDRELKYRTFSQISKWKEREQRQYLE